MSTFQAQVNSATGTVEVASGTITGLTPLAITEEEALYLRANYPGVTVTELPDAPDEQE